MYSSTDTVAVQSGHIKNMSEIIFGEDQQKPAYGNTARFVVRNQTLTFCLRGIFTQKFPIMHSVLLSHPRQGKNKKFKSSISPVYHFCL